MENPEDCDCGNWRVEHPEWIWCDDFENGTPMSRKYFEYGDDEGDFVVKENVGVGGSKGMRVVFQASEVRAGGFKKSFGRTPSAYIGKNSERSEEDFDEIYWRMWLRRAPDWVGGGGAKLSRATVMASEGWAQGMIAHLWSGGANDDYLLIDPASGITAEGELVSTRYNDFANLRWLGNQAGRTALFSEEAAGEWFCIEAHVKLNTPGESDGVFEYWIDERLQVRRRNLNWHGDWNLDPEAYKINAVFFENYWNAGSPKLQERYFDNIVISEERIGCGCNGVDSDYDRIPDAVENESAFFRNGVDDRNVDRDGDGASNTSEHLAGTDPDNPTSVFEITQWTPSDQMVSVCFQAAPGQIYSIETADDLARGEWRYAGSEVVADKGGALCLDAPISNGAIAFYRVVSR